MVSMSAAGTASETEQRDSGGSHFIVDDFSVSQSMPPLFSLPVSSADQTRPGQSEEGGYGCSSAHRSFRRRKAQIRQYVVDTLSTGPGPGPGPASKLLACTIRLSSLGGAAFGCICPHWSRRQAVG